MDTAVSNFIAMCEWDSAFLFIFSDNVFAALIYYSHLLPLIFSLIFGIFVFSHDRNSRVAKALLFFTVSINIWLFFDLILWATEKPQYTMFFWSLINMVEPVIYAGVVYFLYLLLADKHPEFWKKLLMLVLLAPTILLTPTVLALTGFDLTNCDREAVEGPLVYYGYFVEAFFILWIIIFGIKTFINNKSHEERKKIILAICGSILLLLSFAIGNVIGSFFVNWTIGQYGLFGIPVFVGFIAYLITRFKILNIKLLSTQLLFGAIWAMTFAILFVRTVENVRTIVYFTLALFTILGYFLIRSVKQEVELREMVEKQKEGLERANARLEELNRQKSEFVSFATHQLRSPLTAMRGYASMVREGDFGEMNMGVMNVFGVIEKSTRTLIEVVESYLNLSRIELGTMKYDFADFNFNDLLAEVVQEQRPNIEAKGLAFSVGGMDNKEEYKVRMDRDKLKQVVANTIDNSVKYTPSGSVNITLSKDTKRGVIRMEIKDTGVGIDPAVMPKLFQKFSRAPKAGEANIHGTGLGLYIAKEIMTAHKGRIWAESEGEGKGSKFIIELPEVK